MRISRFIDGDAIERLEPARANHRLATPAAGGPARGGRNACEYVAGKPLYELTLKSGAPSKSGRASAMGVSVSVTRQSGNRKWSYVTFCVSSTAPAPCPNINFDTANRRVTFNGMQVQHSGADDSLATAPITLSGSLRWAAADE